MSGSARLKRRGCLVAARTLAPRQQGDLDGLCGLYAILNALRLVLAPARPLVQAEVAALFRYGVKIVETDGALGYAATWGVSRFLFRRLIREMSGRASTDTGVAVQARWPLRKLRLVSRAQLLAAIEAAIDQQQPVLVALSGAHSHYTVICGYSAERLTLFDSSRLRWLRRSGCGPRRDAKQWRHRIGTRSLAVLELG